MLWAGQGSNFMLEEDKDKWDKRSQGQGRPSAFLKVAPASIKVKDDVQVFPSASPSCDEKGSNHEVGKQKIVHWNREYLVTA